MQSLRRWRTYVRTLDLDIRPQLLEFFLGWKDNEKMPLPWTERLESELLGLRLADRVQADVDRVVRRSLDLLHCLRVFVLGRTVSRRPHAASHENSRQIPRPRQGTSAARNSVVRPC